MKKDGVLKSTREVRTFVDLAHGADVLIEKSVETAKGSYYTTMGALLLTAFTFEAYLNHLNKEIFKFCDEIEKLNVLPKYSVLCKHFGLTPDFSSRPYQTLILLFRFRNAIAHGKSVIIQETKAVDLSDTLPNWGAKAHWEEYSVLANAQRAKKDISQIIVELHKVADLGDYPFMYGVASGSLGKKPE